ncbi:MAG TPA: Rieske 2Fe-2S domain-containing protein [Candidatus Acidoferrales bacterium]|nr:Rieske 2Fe-2S domain-containing protein [Candidatus Acidoferrales bacterium]
MEYAKQTLAQLSDDELQAEWEKYLAYSYERQRLRALVQSILRKKSPSRRVKADEIAEGGLATTKAGEDEILLAKVDGRIYAIANACGHLAYPLNQGRLEGHVITCIWHYARFDVRTGEVVSPGVDFDGLKPLHIRISSDGTLEVRGDEPDVHP